MYTASEKFLMPRLFLILLIVTVVLWLLLRYRSEAAQSIPFIVITLALIVGEVIKQVKCFQRGYIYWDIPLHFCSTYFIWFSLAEFTRGKVRATMQNIAVISTLYAALGMYIAPRGIFAEASDNMFADYFAAHTIIFHHLVVLYLMLSIAFHRFHPKKSDAWVWTACFSVYFVTALCCAYTLDTNYFNILDSEIIPPLETFRLQVGQVWYDAFLGFVVIGLGSIALRICARVCKSLEKDEGELELVEVTEEE